MNPAKQPFLEAAKTGRALHVAVHLEWKFIEFALELEAARVARAFSNAVDLAKLVSPQIPTLWAVMDTPLVPEPAPTDRVIMFNNTSALASPEAKQIITAKGITTVIISGISAGACVACTQEEAHRMGLTIITAFEGTDLPDRHLTNPQGYPSWTSPQHFASMHELAQWRAEL